MKTMLLREFNELGMIEFQNSIKKIKAGELLFIPSEVIESDLYSAIITPSLPISNTGSTLKNEVIPSICEVLNLKKNRHYYFNTGLWTWLSAYYFDQICLPSQNGSRKVRELACYVLTEPKNFRKFYRHLLAYPAKAYTELADLSKLYLTGSLSTGGEITEQLSAYQEIAINKPIIESATLLYWDSTKNSIKKGAAGKNSGSVRRFIRLIRQYQLTFDLNSMDGKAIVNLLPKSEFGKWYS